jgi:hypothetical protein
MERESPRMIDRRISVAPMMDWTDALLIASAFKSLGFLARACLLYVSSESKLGRKWRASLSWSSKLDSRFPRAVARRATAMS